MFETPASRAAPLQPRLVLTALLTGSLLFLGIALSLGSVRPTDPAGTIVVWLGLGGAPAGPALGLMVAERLQGNAATPAPDTAAAERAPASARGLIVQGALCEAGAIVCGLAVLLHGTDWRLLAAVVVPLSRLLVLRNRAGESVAQA